MNSIPEADRLSFALVGSGKTAIEISRMLTEEPRARLVGIIGDPRRETPQSSLASEAGKLGVSYIETKSLSAPVALDFMRSVGPDYIISANNFMIFRGDMLAMASIATVNFHNGPLPKYAGLNPVSWAIYNRETDYGITWHLVDEGIDSGAILHVERFPLDPDETAVRAIVKVIASGLRSFRGTVFPRLLERNLSPNSQDMSKRRYFSAKDQPHGGYLPWWLPGNILEPLSRALAFAPLRNSFYRPELRIQNGGSLFCERFEFARKAATSAPGVVLSNGTSSLTIATTDGTITALDLFAGPGLNNMNAIDPSINGPGLGSQLVRPDFV